MARILVVDDEIDTLSVMEQLLHYSGFVPITAHNGRDALTLAASESFDCALLDVMMPEMDGIMLCRMLRVHPATRNLPIIFITAYQSHDVERKCREAGGDLILPKPVGRRMLVETIDKARGMHAAKH